MIGAQALVGSLTGAGVDVCFMNPGTSEMHFVSALDAVPAMRGVLALFEGVATGAADGYARIAGKPAAVLLHLGPGLANGLANLHNARRAGTPVVVIVGAHATGHVRYDAPLQSDIEALARTVSGWVHTSGHPRDLAQDAMRALAAAQADNRHPDPPRRRLLERRRHPGPTPPHPDPPDYGGRPWSTIGDKPARSGGARHDALSRRARPHRARPAGGQPDQRRDRGAAAGRDVPGPAGARRRAAVRRPAGLLAESAETQLAGVEDLVLAGARSPVSFFAYPGRASDLVPPAAPSLPWPTAARTSRPRSRSSRPGRGRNGAGPGGGTLLPAEPGPLNAVNLASTIAASLPEGVIIADEANTSGFALPMALAGAPRHTLLTLTGGSIGQGMQAATGAAIAAPDRPVLSLEADGSALYTIQALWTQAREQLNVTTVLINNAAYAILRMEVARTGAGGEGRGGKGKARERAARMLDLSGPTPDFTQVRARPRRPASRVTTGEELDQALAAWPTPNQAPPPHRGDLVPSIAPPPDAGAWWMPVWFLLLGPDLNKAPGRARRPGREPRGLVTPG